MRVSIIDKKNNHITATEKKHIKVLFAHNMTEGKVNTKTYYITEKSGIYTALICEMEFSEFEQTLHTFLL